ncbi:MAG: N-acetylglucosamine-6-phosphate deacetylase [Acidobacteria bacterium]|nr:N-acetylglucosamine-6-phosphate deacetylase [Acidobacteriota bacterium]MBP8273790.1 N-acetylglucosamine-6-phosphate deacetylase [Acidobacteriota bacterium]
MERILLTGADLVLPDRVAANHTLVIEEGRIADISTGLRTVSSGERRIDLTGFLIVPGFVDVHVHGVLGRDVQDGAGSIAAIAAELPRYGVTAFCPTTVACTPEALTTVLAEVRALRAEPNLDAARVLPAHLESNFISPEFCGAQPMECLRSPRSRVQGSRSEGQGPSETFSGDDILNVVNDFRPDVSIMTVAPELDNGLELVRSLAEAGIIVSLGHSAAGYEQSLAAIAAGARQATHLFNRMTPMTHRDPGMVGAILGSDDVAAEIICDGHHVHPAVMRVAIDAKTPSRIMAITDGTAGSGLPRGSKARLGGRTITVEEVARLDDRTMAGSVLTMDRAFACMVGQVGAGLVDGVRMCSTTPASELGLQGHGVLATGAVADLVVLDANLTVRQTWIGGRLIFNNLSVSE